MPDFVPTTTEGRAGLASVIADPARALFAFDFDGTLSPIVADPATAYAQPGMVEALARLAASVGHLAIITGRPAGTAVELAGLAEASGLDGLVILGQYGFERWDGVTREGREPTRQEGPSPPQTPRRRAPLRHGYVLRSLS